MVGGPASHVLFAICSPVCSSCGSEPGADDAGETRDDGAVSTDAGGQDTSDLVFDESVIRTYDIQVAADDWQCSMTMLG